MNLTIDLTQTRKLTLGSVVLSRLKALVSSDDQPGMSAAPTARPYSFWSECECPESCLRDHENE